MFSVESAEYGSTPAVWTIGTVGNRAIPVYAACSNRFDKPVTHVHAINTAIIHSHDHAVLL